MGFESPRTVLVLDFTDTDLAGLEVRMRSQTVQELKDGTARMASIASVAKSVLGLDPNDEAAAQAAIAGLDTEALDAVDDTFADFAKHLVSWNLTENGVDVPATLEGIGAQDSRFILRLVGAWQQGMSGVDNPLPRSSSNGRPPDALSMPMVPLEASLAS
ncbi:hypothetical protein Caci_2838 [Catenulispora acidiphila DSM 44928]|uniref:Uncharacterized protein n=1 Tax=Catenulispora acidiphila (strain DSM 44928 / JCM 14897 / NBRC 102108 / NRRL B-24433 / ID139908) TaxID=479433 RepID=C7Q172_CATAD|nr:hypothetical protein [Catenulispora acidiphila]ACU71747.1 hypothetical protein Caci_2838 [Catenulispora acidiphila DSM 44928]